MSEDLVFDEVPVETAPEAVPETPPEPEAPPEEAAEPEAVEPDEAEEEEKPHKKTGSQRWKEKAAREAQEKEYWKAQALQQKAPETPATVQPISADGPKQEDYETHTEWVKASIRHEAKAMIEAEKRQASWEQKSASARAKFEDFDDALQTAPAPSRAVAEVLSESPQGAEVAYHLATHPDLYTRINRLPPVAAALELGRIEAGLAAPVAVKKAAAPITKAPKPPSPVTAAVTNKPSDDGRLETY